MVIYSLWNWHWLNLFGVACMIFQWAVKWDPIFWYKWWHTYWKIGENPAIIAIFRRETTFRSLMQLCINRVRKMGTSHQKKSRPRNSKETNLFFKVKKTIFIEYEIYAFNKLIFLKMHCFHLKIRPIPSPIRFDEKQEWSTMGKAYVSRCVFSMKHKESIDQIQYSSFHFGFV